MFMTMFMTMFDGIDESEDSLFRRFVRVPRHGSGGEGEAAGKAQCGRKRNRGTSCSRTAAVSRAIKRTFQNLRDDHQN